MAIRILTIDEKLPEAIVQQRDGLPRHAKHNTFISHLNESTANTKRFLNPEIFIELNCS
jgi:hypothetical protein